MPIAEGEDGPIVALWRDESGLDESGSDESSAVRVVVLGEPERSGGAFLRYLARGRYLHLEFGAEGRLSPVTLMVEAP